LGPRVIFLTVILFNDIPWLQKELESFYKASNLHLRHTDSASDPHSS